MTNCKACGNPVMNYEVHNTEQTLFCERCFTISCNLIRSQIYLQKKLPYKFKQKTNQEYLQEFMDENK